MPRYVCTVKLGSNGAGVTCRDTETGHVIGFTLSAPREIVEAFIKGIFKEPIAEVHWE